MVFRNEIGIFLSDFEVLLDLVLWRNLVESVEQQVLNGSEGDSLGFLLGDCVGSVHGCCKLI